MGEVGPHAPTLCAGWDVADLAAHLVAREHRPDALPGLGISLFAAHTERVRLAVRDAQPFPELLRTLRSGPPLLFKPLDSIVEFFVHHEDVRRAAHLAPRLLSASDTQLLWRRLRMVARFVAHRLPVGLSLQAPGYGRITSKRAEPHVTLTGPPGELLLFLFGRQRAAQVLADGTPRAVERLWATPLRF